MVIELFGNEAGSKSVCVHSRMVIGSMKYSQCACGPMASFPRRLAMYSLNAYGHPLLSNTIRNIYLGLNKYLVETELKVESLYAPS